MAFNKAPNQSTYQSRDVKLLMSINNRDTAATKDVIPVNGFYETVNDRNTGTQEFRFVKRDGLSLFPHVPSGTRIRGMHFWKEQDKLFVAYDDKIDVITASTGVLITSLTPFLTTTGDVGFTEFQYASGVVDIVACDGSRLITINAANLVTQGSDADMPTPMKPHIVYLDGYIFLIKDGTSDIYNSNLDNPLAFTAGDFITAEMLPDSLVRIARLRNYLAAFGTASIEYFYNAANASASPLSRNDTPLKQVGLLGGMAFYDSKIFFVGLTGTTGPEVMMVEDFKLERMDSPPIRRYVQPYTTFDAAVVSLGGRDFYVLNVGPITYMMDLETRIWTRLSFGNTSVFPIKYATNIVRTGIGNTSVIALGTNTNLYLFNPAVYQDDGVNFTVVLQTDNEDFDSSKEKTMSRVSIIADRPVVSAQMSVSVSDDDFQTYSTPRTVELNQERPMLHRWGRFIKRALRFEFTANAPMRIKNVEVDINYGNR